MLTGGQSTADISLFTRGDGRHQVTVAPGFTESRLPARGSRLNRLPAQADGFTDRYTQPADMAADLPGHS